MVLTDDNSNALTMDKQTSYHATTLIYLPLYAIWFWVSWRKPHVFLRRNGHRVDQDSSRETWDNVVISLEFGTIIRHFKRVSHLCYEYWSVFYISHRAFSSIWWYSHLLKASSHLDFDICFHIYIYIYIYMCVYIIQMQYSHCECPPPPRYPVKNHAP